MQQQAISIKLVVVGDGSVGKTCMLVRYTKNKFPTDYIPTVFENYCAQIKVDDKMVNLNLWDTAGQEEYEQLRQISYPQSDIFLIVFSVNEPNSFANAIKKWHQELSQQQPNTIKMVVGTKVDLRPTENVDDSKFVTYPIAQKVVSDIGCKYMECSALNGQGLKQVFDEAIRQVLKKKFPNQEKKAPQQQRSGGQRNSNQSDNSGKDCIIM